MDTSAEIKRALIEALGVTPNLPITATVVSVEEDTITVTISDSLDLSDVRLKSIITEDQSGLLVIPAIGSEVLVMSQTGELSGLFVIKVDLVDKLIYKLDDFEFIVDGTTKKVTIKNQSANVGNLVGTLIETISNAIIQTPAGVGNFAPTTVQNLTNLKNQFKTILNDN